MKVKHTSKSQAVKEHSGTGWKMLMVPNVILTAWFMCLVTGIPTLANDIKLAFMGGDSLSWIAYGVLALVFMFASALYGIGLTKTELSANIEGTRKEKKRNKAALWAMFTLICITGIAGGIWRYNDVKKTQSKQAQIWLSENHTGYQKYMAMTENGFAGDDEIADRGMVRLETDWINENYKTPWYMDLPLVFIMALSINLTFGLAVRLSHEELPDFDFGSSQNGNGKPVKASHNGKKEHEYSANENGKKNDMRNKGNNGRKKQQSNMKKRIENLFKIRDSGQRFSTKKELADKLEISTETLNKYLDNYNLDFDIDFSTSKNSVNVDSARQFEVEDQNSMPKFDAGNSRYYDA